jgi:hypothetical protein
VFRRLRAESYLFGLFFACANKQAAEFQADSGTSYSRGVQPLAHVFKLPTGMCTIPIKHATLNLVELVPAGESRVCESAGLHIALKSF